METAVSSLAEWRENILPTPPKPSTDQLKQRQLLFGLMHRHFSDEEVKTLCFSLGIDYDDLGGGGKDDHIRELLFTVFRRQKTGDLLKELRRVRPLVSW